MKTFLEFEIFVMDMVAEREIDDGGKLRDFSDKLHQSVENALMDYSEDKEIDGYDPMY